MSASPDPATRSIFFSDTDAGGVGTPAALLVAGACGNVGLGKLGQFARLMQPLGIPVIALDLSPAVHDVPGKLREAMQKRIAADRLDAIVANITVVQGTLADIPAHLRLGFVFEAIPEKLEIKHAFYRALRARDPHALAFSATSGITTRKLFGDLPGAERSGVLHPFFPHLTNKLWELPVSGATTSKETVRLIRTWMGALGMTLIEVADVPAFAADRMFCGMMLEAVRIHEDTGLSPAQIDDVCKQVLGTSPFFVHNLIPGANYLSAHCMELMAEEVDSTLYRIPAAWRPAIADPRVQWPYEKGARCPADRRKEVEGRMLGMLYSLAARLLDARAVAPDALNFLCENALAFRVGVPAMMQADLAAAKATITAFVEGQSITQAAQVAPLAAVEPAAPHWGQLYVGRSVHDGVGLLSLKRLTINHALIAELDAGIEALNADPAVRAIVIAPDGSLSREFGHGADPNCFVPVLGDAPAALSMIEAWKRTTAKLRGKKPTVAALVGRVFGGSLELASNCSARIGAAGTVLGQPEPTVGVLPALGGCHLIHRWSSPQFAARISALLLTGHDFSIDEAHSWGLVSEIVPVADLPRASMALAAALAGGAVSLPAFRDGPATPPLAVARDVDPRNKAGVAHDAELRALIAQTIEAANNAPFAAGSAAEAAAGAKALTQSASKIGVQALLRGKPPEFEHKLA